MMHATLFAAILKRVLTALAVDDHASLEKRRGRGGGVEDVARNVPIPHPHHVHAHEL